jgi:hypothetical protein
MTAIPISRTCATKSSGSISTRKPGIDSSLSSVPPVWPSPRPDIFAMGTPQLATSGASTSVVLSPTPPVECLSTLTPGMPVRSIISPLRAMASVSHTVSSPSSPLSSAAMSQAAIW